MLSPWTWAITGATLTSRAATLLAAISMVAFSTMADAAAPKPPLASCPVDPEFANLIAGSDLILIGRMEVPKQRLMEEAHKSSPDYLDIPTQIDGVVKGGAVGRATVRFYPQDAAYKPSNDAVLGLAGAPAILFLSRVDEGPVGHGRPGLYFADSPEALKPGSEQAIGAARAEVARQAQIIHSWRADATLPRFGEVRALIARLGRVDGDEQQRVFEGLAALGDEAVPAIIAQMDDRRPLRTRALFLVNHAPDAFERVHYGPERVVDGLDAILNQITGVSFGWIMNGGSDRERDAVVAGWRVYAADLECSGAR
jgi:hypothetical protein